jgi:hypothetical protein
MADPEEPGKASKLPSRHVAEAALHVARIIDDRGSRHGEAYESYWHHMTGGTFAPTDLERGQRLLLEVGLVVERDEKLVPDSELKQLLDGTIDDACAALGYRVLRAERAGALTREPIPELSQLVPDAARREELLLSLARRFDDQQRRTVGDIGEEIVLRAARNELLAMTRPDLAREVLRVSLISDQLGYDITAPRVSGPKRLLEVKATTGGETPLRIYLSRNEADTGIAFPDWALVVCVVDEVEQRSGHVVGWCTAGTLAPLLPVDSPAARWEQAAIALPDDFLRPGLPGVVV